MPVILQRIIYPLLYALILFVFALLFAPLGFNPTDDGVVLAQTARFWAGQIPFLDFISIRPFASVLLHWPALFFGEYQLLASRYISILEVGFYAYAFLYLSVRYMRIQLSALSFWSLAAISFFVNMHSFPIMAWTSIDALFLVAFGLYLRDRFAASSWQIVFAYILVGFAALCRQTYVPVGILCLWFFHDHKQWKAYLGLLLPYLVFITYLFWKGITKEAYQQLSASSLAIKDILGVLFFYKGSYTGLLIGGMLVLLWQFQKHRPSRWLQYFVLIFPFLMLIVYMLLLIRSNAYRYMPIAFWLMLIPILGSEMRFHRQSRYYALFILAFFVSGVCALSIGYPSPALLTAWPFILLLLWVIKRFTPSLSLQWIPFVSLLLVACLAVVVRLNHIYREPQSELLQYKTKHYGLQGIWMDRTTAEALNELARWKSHLKGSSIVLFDFAATRLSDRQTALLAGDWITQEEFPNQQLQAKVFRSLQSKSTRFWIVQKYCSAELSDTLLPIEARKDSFQLKLLNQVRKQSIIYNEGKYFIIYRQ